jgi:thiosulfate reductase cytochrome b subunit
MSAMLDKQAGARRRQTVHPLVVRITHWVNALTILMMVTSGWRIYNASPLFGFRFPPELTIGGWLGGAIAWHFAAMWLLAANGLVYLVHGFVSGHFRRNFLPLTVAGLVSDLKAALAFRLVHRPGHYNAVQRLLYAGVIALILAVVLSGLTIWKPVQLQSLATLLGGYEAARRVHFLAMAGIVGFVVVHLVLVALVPKTLVPMITGRARSRATESETTP